MITHKDERCIDMDQTEAEIECTYNAATDEQIKDLSDRSVYCTQFMEYRFAIYVLEH